MYAGNGNVYNICAEDMSHTTALIKLQSLKEVCELFSEPQYQVVRINNHTIEAAHLRLTARSPADCLRAASAMDGQCVPYNFLKENCEYYCTLWRFGRGFSEQVDFAVGVARSMAN